MITVNTNSDLAGQENIIVLHPFTDPLAEDISKIRLSMHFFSENPQTGHDKWAVVWSSYIGASKIEI